MNSYIVYFPQFIYSPTLLRFRQESMEFKGSIPFNKLLCPIKNGLT